MRLTAALLLLMAACGDVDYGISLSLDGVHVQMIGGVPSAHGAAGGAAATTFQDAARQFQAQLLSNVLVANDWNIPATASQLALHT